MIKYNYFSTLNLTITVSLTLIYLIIRIFIGLDFTDEMQYFGQIHGLILFDKLFINDFFIQQTGYLLIYPFLKLILLFDPEIQFIHLIFYTRILFFLFILSLSFFFFT